MTLSLRTRRERKERAADLDDVAAIIEMINMNLAAETPDLDRVRELIKEAQEIIDRVTRVTR